MCLGPPYGVERSFSCPSSFWRDAHELMREGISPVQCDACFLPLGQDDPTSEFFTHSSVAQLIIEHLSRLAAQTRRRAPIGFVASSRALTLHLNAVGSSPYLGVQAPCARRSCAAGQRLASAQATARLGRALPPGCKACDVRRASREENEVEGEIRLLT